MIMDRIALALAIIGGINWGSVGLFRFDIVAWLFGGQTATVSRVVYTLVGLSALWCITLQFRGREEESSSTGTGSRGPGPRQFPCLKIRPDAAESRCPGNFYIEATEQLRGAEIPGAAFLS